MLLIFIVGYILFDFISLILNVLIVFFFIVLIVFIGECNDLFIIIFVLFLFFM